jgi:hypothetical protein
MRMRHAKRCFADDCYDDAQSSHSAIKPSGGARRDRTDDLMLAKHALSQLSYGPVPEDECLTSAIGDLISQGDNALDRIGGPGKT